jgi:diacylglycerol kinase
MKKFLLSVIYAITGIRVAFATGRNLKIQLVVAVMTIAAGFCFHVSATEWCIILIMVALVIGFELMNSAIESLVNLVTTEWLPLAGKVKDIAAGAVLVTSFIAMIIGIIIFWKYILALGIRH